MSYFSDQELVLKSIDALPKQLTQSFVQTQEIDFPLYYKNIKNIIVAGMGGSRFPSLIIRELFKEKITLPYLVNDDYTLPGFVDKKTLVILSSYSGNTEEVIEMGRAAFKKRAKLTGITSGGELASFLKQVAVPRYIFNPGYNPSKQPRIGFGYMVGGHLGFLVKLGFLKEKKEKIAAATEKLFSLIKVFKKSVPEKENPAKRLAKKLYQKYPYYIVSEFLTGVGNAVANQTNETAKTISSFRVIPELNHHLMEGLRFPKSHKKIALFVFFFSQLYSPPIKKRFLITKEVVEKNGVKTIWYQLQGKNKIEQVFELMALGSYFTMYLSLLYRQNPALVPYVEYFKNKLKEK